MIVAFVRFERYEVGHYLEKRSIRKYKGNTKYKNSTLTEEIVISDMIWTCKEYCIAAFVNGS